MRRTKDLSTILIVVLILIMGQAQFVFASETEMIEDAYGRDVDVSLGLETRKYEIAKERAIMEDAQNVGETYDELPQATSPYVVGSLSEDEIEGALATLNYIRFLAGLENSVEISEEWNEEAQYASLVNAANQELSHYPDKPDGMSESMYERGYNGSSTSNLYMASWQYSVSDSLWRYMADSDANNLADAGHRRWLLNPMMDTTGFGQVGSYSATKVFSMEKNLYYSEEDTTDYVAWPSAGDFPMDEFDIDSSWSVSLNTSKYDASQTDKIRVTVTDLSTGVSEYFDDETESADDDSDKFFTVNTEAYGVPYCIIFRPEFNSSDRNFEDGDSYHVKISGLYDLDGNYTSIEYDVHFFDTSDWEPSTLEGSNLYYAQQLDALNLFNGSDEGYELDRQMTRIEGLTMIIRLLGKEDEADDLKDKTSSFTDLPDWGVGYANEAYDLGISKGIGDGLFGSDQIMEAKAFMTMLLRALGYDDQIGDFTYENSLEDAYNLGVVDQATYENLSDPDASFLRSDLVAICYQALTSQVVNSNGQSLAENLGLSLSE